MARLHEHQGKAILQEANISIPRGRVASSIEDAGHAARDIGLPCMIKIQAWTTGRAAIGGVSRATTPPEVEDHARRMLALTVGQFPVTHLLIEEMLPIDREYFVSFSIDDRARAPVLLFAASGGSGVEDRASEVARIPCSARTGPDTDALRRAIENAAIEPAHQPAMTQTIVRLFEIARSRDCRSLEINPLVITKDGRIVALDCRMTIDDAAVFRQPDLGIEIARELDHPPTDLEKIAYRVEQEDHRGTFFFAQMNTQPAPGSKGLVGFHGAGGGGSMMSMDAITNEGFTIANFTDTSGNPSAAKVYRAARIILSQTGLCGYFGSGSGVASQEQFWSAYGLAKAFWELDLNIPAVIRLGGNTEDRAVEILHDTAKSLKAPVEGYKKSDPPATIASRFAELVDASSPARKGAGGSAGARWIPRPPRRPAFVGASASVSFPIKGGRLWIDAAAWPKHSAAIISRAAGLLRDDAGKPALAVSPEDLLSKDSELIMCEVECRNAGIEGVYMELEIPGLDARSDAKAR